MTQLRLFAIALLVLVLPILTYADGEQKLNTDGLTAVSENPSEIAQPTRKAPPSDLESKESLDFYDPLKLLGEPVFLSNPQQAPPPGSCTHRCPMGLPLECPSYIGVPPATCENGCCEYQGQGCQTTCSFDSDCEDPRDEDLGWCWDGCCVFPG